MSEKQKNSVVYPQPPKEYKEFEENVTISPPPLPQEDHITVFGYEQPGKNLTLEEQNIPVLYDQNAPPLLELKKINHQILFTYQKLVGIIADGNEDPDPILTHIKNLFLNAYYILNELRSIQAYEQASYCLKEQTQRLTNFKQEFQNCINRVSQLRPPKNDE